MEVNLREFVISDLEELYSLFCDSIILKNLEIGKSKQEFTLEDEREWLRRTISQYSAPKSTEYHLAIELNKRLAGSIGAFNYDYENKTAEVGIWMGRVFWGSGAVPLIMELFRDKVLQRYDLERAITNIDENNRIAQKIAESFGFRRIERRKAGEVSYEIFRQNGNR